MIRSVLVAILLISCNSGGGGGTGRAPSRGVIPAGSNGSDQTSSSSSGSGSSGSGLPEPGSGGDGGAGGGQNLNALYYRPSLPNIPFAQYVGRSVGDLLSYNFCEGLDGNLTDENDKKSFNAFLKVKIIKDKIEALRADSQAHCKKDMIEFLQGVKELDLSGLGIKSLAILSGFQSLEKLNVNNNDITDQQLGYLVSAKKLRAIFIAQNALTSASVLREIPSLVSIDLHSNELNEINFIPYMPNLRRVDAAKNKLKSIASILDYANKFNASLVLNVEGNPDVKTELASVQERELSCLLRDDVILGSECANLRLKIGFLSTFIPDYDDAPGNRLEVNN